MELRHLKYFVALAEELHFGKAAQRLYITQPTLSNQIVQLEEELGRDLFSKALRKQKHKVELTAAGQLVLLHAKEIIRLAENLKNEISLGKNHIRLAIYQSGLKDIVTSFIKSITHKDHLIHVEEFNNSNKVIDEVTSGRSDMGLVLNYPSDGVLWSKKIFRGTLQIAVNKSHPLARKKTLCMADLVNQEWIELKKEIHPFWNEIESLFNTINYKRSKDIVQTVSNLDLLCTMVDNGLGICFLNSQFDISKYKNIKLKPLLISKKNQESFVYIENFAVISKEAKPEIKTIFERIKILKK